MPKLLKTEKVIFNLGAICSATHEPDEAITISLQSGELIRLYGNEAAQTWQLLERAACTAEERLSNKEPMLDV